MILEVCDLVCCTQLPIFYMIGIYTVGNLDYDALWEYPEKNPGVFDQKTENLNYNVEYGIVSNRVL